jgi:putative SOS response-associated peptidase YedK
MCGRVIQSSGPVRYGILAGMDPRDTRVHNYPPRWNAAPSQELLVIRRNHQTGEISTRVNKPENGDPSILEPLVASA